jgi:hypothetical protein
MTRISGVVQMAVTRVITGGTIILNTKQTFNITNDTLTRYTTSKRSFYVVSSEDIKITPYIRKLDSDWLIAVIFYTNSGLAL